MLILYVLRMAVKWNPFRWLKSTKNMVIQVFLDGFWRTSSQISLHERWQSEQTIPRADWTWKYRGEYSLLGPKSSYGSRGTPQWNIFHLIGFSHKYLTEFCYTINFYGIYIVSDMIEDISLLVDPFRSELLTAGSPTCTTERDGHMGISISYTERSSR